jgi:hypothetical protein
MPALRKSRGSGAGADLFIKFRQFGLRGLDVRNFRFAIAPMLY